MFIKKYFNVSRLQNGSPDPLNWEALHDDSCQNIMMIIDLLLSLPPTSVSCETSFSQMKLIKTSRGARLASSTLDNLMQIKLNTAEVGQYDPQEAIDQWLVSN